MLPENFLWRPVDPWVTTQRFGENRACADIATGRRYITCDGHNPPTGYKSVYSQMKGHNGLDVIASRWQPVYAAHDGIVEELETEVDRGLGVGIVTSKRYGCAETGQAEFFKTRYWHLIAIQVKLGDRVRPGSLIGWADSTGISSGDHLHFELKVVTKGKNGRWVNVLQDNGYFGAIDPSPYMINLFALKGSTFISLIEQVANVLDYWSDKVRGLAINK
jgi:murein DD-endopeptidase MepM/ murein hydrolase activator NlpD